MRMTIRALAALAIFLTFAAFSGAQAANTPCADALAGQPFPDELDTNCYSWDGAPARPTTHFLYPGAWGAEPSAEHIRILENLRSAYVHSLERFSANDIGLNFAVAEVNVAIELDPMPGALASAHWNNGNRSGEGPCWAKIYPAAWEDPPEETKQTLAHELGHCVIMKGVETPYTDGSQWWQEDGAEYFGTVAYPRANAEHSFAAGYRENLPIFNPENAYRGVLFLEHYAQKIGGGRPSSVLALLARLPAPDDWDENYRLLASDTRLAAAFHSFAKALASEGVTDSGGGSMPMPELNVLNRFSPDATEGRQTAEINALPWAIGATVIDIPAGWSFKFDLDASAPESFSLSIKRQGATSWTDLYTAPSATIASSCYEPAVAILMPTSSAADEGMQSAKIGMTGTQVEECEDEEETASECDCMGAVDACVVGEWVRDSEEVLRGFTQGQTLPAGARIENNQSGVDTSFGGNGAFSQDTRYFFDIRYAAEFGEARGVMRVTRLANGKWCARAGQMCVHATSVENGPNMAYMEVMGQRMPIPLMSVPFAAPAKSRYECSGDSLKVFADGDIKGRPVTLEYRWRRRR